MTVETVATPVGPVIPAPAPVTVTDNRLGCGEYEAVIMTRGGQQIVGFLPVSSAEWHRVLDDTSTGQAVIGGVGGALSRECCKTLDVIEPWVHELGLFRSGQRAWCGPIVEPVMDRNSDSATIAARDVSVWLDRRVLHVDHNYKTPGPDLSVIFTDYFNDAMLLENSAGLTITATPCGVTGSRATLATDCVSAGSQIRELSRTGIDWTTIDREILVGGSVVGAAPLTILYDDHFSQPPQVALDGLAQATKWYVVGAGKGRNMALGTAQAPDALIQKYGLLEQAVKEPLILDQGSADAAAGSRLSLTAKPPGVIQSGILSPLAPITLAQLVPGMIIRVLLVSTCYAVDGVYRLKSVDATVSPDQDEQIGRVAAGEGHEQAKEAGYQQHHHRPGLWRYAEPIPVNEV